MEYMNDQIREAVRVGMAKKNWRQSDLAEHANLSKQHVSQLMTGRVGNIHAAWERIFDELGLELVVQPKEQRQS